MFIIPNVTGLILLCDAAFLSLKYGRRSKPK